MGRYVLKGGDEGAARLRLLARVLAPTTHAFIQQCAPLTGKRCLDVGCGIGEVSAELARSVGPRGSVHGVDKDGRAIAIAKQEANRKNLNVQFVCGSIYDLGTDDAFDLAYARFVFSHLGDPDTALRSIVKLLAPSGVVAIEDVDFPAHTTWPPCRAFERYVELYQQVVHRNGGDAAYGRKLYRLLVDHGFERVHVSAVQPVYASGEGKLLARVTLDHIRPAIIDAKLADAGEIESILSELDEFAARDDTVISLPRIFQVRGYLHG